MLSGDIAWEHCTLYHRVSVYFLESSQMECLECTKSDISQQSTCIAKYVSLCNLIKELSTTLVVE